MLAFVKSTCVASTELGDDVRLPENNYACARLIELHSGYTCFHLQTQHKGM